MNTKITTWGKQMARAFVLTMVLLLSSSASVFAGGTKYYDFYATLQAYPTGAGKVYAEEPAGSTTSDDEASDLYADMKTPAEAVDVKFILSGSSSNATYTAYALPTEGWILAGFSVATVVNDGEFDDFVFNDDIVNYDNPAQMDIASTTSEDSEEKAEGSFPFFSEALHYALFTHVAPVIATGQSSLGTVKSSKVCNEIGDNVTLTATPNDETTTQFDYWLNKSTGEKIPTNPLTINNISGTAYYEAHFKSTQAIDIKFPEEGGYKVVYFPKGYDMPDKVVNELQFSFADISNNSLHPTDDASGYYLDSYEYSQSLYGNEPHILYGKGTMTFVANDSYDVDSYSSNILKWSGENGCNVKDMTIANKYYRVDIENQQFHLLADDAVIEPNTAYLALPIETYKAYDLQDAPEDIYWFNQEGDPTGIEAIQAGKLEKAAAQGIYTLDGKKLDKISGRGLYIINGKKVLKLK